MTTAELTMLTSLSTSPLSPSLSITPHSTTLTPPLFPQFLTPLLSPVNPHSTPLHHATPTPTSPMPTSLTHTRSPPVLCFTHAPNIPTKKRVIQ
ncbi:hypothetical protein FKM82_008164 [Ascaphus truei]